MTQKGNPGPTIEKKEELIPLKAKIFLGALVAILILMIVWGINKNRAEYPNECIGCNEENFSNQNHIENISIYPSTIDMVYNDSKEIYLLFKNNGDLTTNFTLCGLYIGTENACPDAPAGSDLPSYKDCGLFQGYQADGISDDIHIETNETQFSLQPGEIKVLKTRVISAKAENNSYDGSICVSDGTYNNTFKANLKIMIIK